MNFTHPEGNATYTAGGAIAKGDVVKFSDGKVVPCTGDTDAAIGVALDAATTDGEIVPVAILGVFHGTVLVKASEAVSAGATVNPTGGAAGEGDLAGLERGAGGEDAEIGETVLHFDLPFLVVP